MKKLLQSFLSTVGGEAFSVPGLGSKYRKGEKLVYKGRLGDKLLMRIGSKKDGEIQYYL